MCFLIKSQLFVNHKSGLRGDFQELKGPLIAFGILLSKVHVNTKILLTVIILCVLSSWECHNNTYTSSSNFIFILQDTFTFYYRLCLIILEIETRDFNKKQQH